VSAYALQNGLFAALSEVSEASLTADFLTEDYTLTTVEIAKAVAYLRDNVIGIYDNPAQVADPASDAAFPFITLSGGTSQPWDTDTDRGDEAIVQVHVWSRASNSLETKQIQDAIYSILHRGTIVISGSVFIGSDYITQTVQRDPDGITRHGVQEFRIIYEEA